MNVSCIQDRPAETQTFLDARYTETHILGIILAISAKVISNCSDRIFHTALDPAFADHAWSPEA